MLDDLEPDLRRLLRLLNSTPKATNTVLISVCGMLVSFAAQTSRADLFNEKQIKTASTGVIPMVFLF
jgi:hypothetical protein